MADKKFFVDGPTWFLLVLFYCRIITDCFAKYPIGILVFWVVGFILIDHIKVFNIIFLPQAFMAFPFYVIGYKYKDKISNIVNSKHAYLGGGICLLLTLIITTWHGRVSMKGVKFGFDDTPYLISIACFYINAFIGSFMVLFFSSLSKGLLIITNIAKSLITILCVHIIFVFASLKVIGWNAAMYVTLPMSFAILLLCYCIHILIIKYCPIVIGR